MRVKTILFLAICLLSAVVAHGQTALKTQLQAKLDEWHKAGSFPGATFGVVLANGESFGLAVGFSDRTARTPMKPTDRMPAGSVGKTFAAATALQLIKEGKIGLDDKIEKYLGREQWFSRLPNAKDIKESKKGKEGDKSAGEKPVKAKSAKTTEKTKGPAARPGPLRSGSPSPFVLSPPSRPG